MKVKKVKITWQKIDTLAKKLSKQILDMKKLGYEFDAIICVGRGSMVPSRLISEYTDIKQIYFADVKAYTDDNKLGKVSCKLYMPKLHNKGIIIVDDCLTTGTTLDAVYKAVASKASYCRYVYKAVLFQNKCSLQYVLHGQKYDAKTTWLVFPWEKK